MYVIIGASSPSTRIYHCSLVINENKMQQYKYN